MTSQARSISLFQRLPSSWHEPLKLPNLASGNLIARDKILADEGLHNAKVICRYDLKRHTKLILAAGSSSYLKLFWKIVTHLNLNL